MALNKKRKENPKAENPVSLKKANGNGTSNKTQNSTKQTQNKKQDEAILKMAAMEDDFDSDEQDFESNSDDAMDVEAQDFDDEDDNDMDEFGQEESDEDAAPMEHVQKPKKYDPRFAPPTNDEIRKLSETEQLFKSNLFRLQLNELFTEVKVNYTKTTALENALFSLKEALDGLSEREVTSTTGLAKLPIYTTDIESLKFRFKAPKGVDVVGSFLLKTVTKPVLNVDVAVEIPSSCFKDKDVLNYRYHDKRNLYLAVLADQLNKMEQYNGTLSFSTFHGDTSKPILLIHPKKDPKIGVKTKFVIRIFPMINKSTITLSKLLPTKNNRREINSNNPAINDKEHQKQQSSNNNNEDIGISAYYNNTILEDMFYVDHLQSIHKHMNGNDEGAQNLREAVMLFKVWARQRGLTSSADGVDSFVLTMILLHLTDLKKISSHMSCYQMFKLALQYLSTVDVRQGIFMNSSAKHSPEIVKAYLKSFPVVFLDYSGHLNLTGRVTRAAWLEFIDHCKQSLALVSDPVTDGFEALFIQKIQFNKQYDQYIQIEKIPVSLMEDQTLKMKLPEPDKGVIMTSPAYHEVYVRTVDHIHQLLEKGLTQRAVAIREFPLQESSHEWKLSDIQKDSSWATQVYPTTLTIGVRVDPVKARSKIDIGPAADDEAKVALFKEFWGSKAEMRRFKDGSIVQAAVWECSTNDERALILARIVNHLLELHCHISPSTVYHIGNSQFDTLLHIPNQQLVVNKDAKKSDQQPVMFSYVDSTPRLIQNYELLGKHLRAMELPLNIVGLQTVSPAFRYTEVFPAFASANNTGVNHSQQILSTPLHVVLQLESSSSWPDDLAAIEHIKLAFYLKMAENFRRIRLKTNVVTKQPIDQLRPPWTLDAVSSHLEVVFEDVNELALAFHFHIAHEREFQLLERDETKRELAQFLRHELIVKPLHSSFLHGFHMKFTAFGPTVRLVQRWLHSHMFSGHFTVEFVELLVAYLFTNPRPYNVPNTGFVGFQRFLHLLSTFDFEQNPIIVDFDNEINADTYTKIISNFSRLRESQGKSSNPSFRNSHAAFIATSKDLLYPTPLSSPWTQTQPSRQILKRMITYAKRSEALLDDLMRVDDTIVQSRAILNHTARDAQWKVVFKTPLSDYDLLIHLKPENILHLEQSIKFALHEWDSATMLSKLKKKPDLKEHLSKHAAIVGLNTVQLYLSDLQHHFGEHALFFHDALGGDTIAVVWKPSYFLMRPFKLLNAAGSIPITGEYTAKSQEKKKSNSGPSFDVVPNIFEILTEMKDLGKGLVDSITVNQGK